MSVDYQKLSPEELEDLAQDVERAASAAWSQAVTEIAKINEIRDRKLAEASVAKRLESMTDAERKVMAQVLSPPSVPSAEAVSADATVPAG